jgi:hypothetical protein
LERHKPPQNCVCRFAFRPFNVLSAVGGFTAAHGVRLLYHEKQGASLGAAQAAAKRGCGLPFGHSMFSQPSAVYRRLRREVIISRKQGVCLGAAQAVAKQRMRFCLLVIQCSLSRRRFYRRPRREVIISRKQGVSLGAAQAAAKRGCGLPFGHSMFSQPSAVLPPNTA